MHLLVKINALVVHIQCCIQVAFYRARFGEIEYYDTDIFMEKASLPPQAFSIVNGEVIFNGDYISFIDKTTRNQSIEELLAYFNKPI